jgi:hypothetical protein
VRTTRGRGPRMRTRTQPSTRSIQRWSTRTTPAWTSKRGTRTRHRTHSPAQIHYARRRPCTAASPSPPTSISHFPTRAGPPCRPWRRRTHPPASSTTGPGRPGPRFCVRAGRRSRVRLRAGLPPLHQHLRAPPAPSPAPCPDPRHPRGRP